MEGSTQNRQTGHERGGEILVRSVEFLDYAGDAQAIVVQAILVAADTFRKRRGALGCSLCD